MTPGQRAYEKDVEQRPLYHDGTPRKPWAALDGVVRWSWEKNPYPLPCAPNNAGGN